MSNHHKTTLSVAEHVRLNTWVLDIAEAVRGPAREEGDGKYRLGDDRALLIHPGAGFYDLVQGVGGRGALALIELLHKVNDAGAMKLAREWLASRQGEGRLAHGIADDEDAPKSADDAQRTAEIETVWHRRQLIEGTPAETYLRSRGLTSCDALGWLPNLRVGEGAMIAAVTDPAGKLVAIQLTYITPDGRSRR